MSHPLITDPGSSYFLYDQLKFVTFFCTTSFSSRSSSKTLWSTFAGPRYWRFNNNGIAYLNHDSLSHCRLARQHCQCKPWPPPLIFWRNTWTESKLLDNYYASFHILKYVSASTFPLIPNALPPKCQHRSLIKFFNNSLGLHLKT